MTEEELLQDVINRKPGAWRQFEKTYRNLIVSIIKKVARRYSALNSEEDLEDLVSATILHMVKDDYKKLRAFDPSRGYKLSSWIALLTSNVTHDSLRHRGERPKKVSLNEGKKEIRKLTGDYVDIEKITLVRTLINTLPQKEKDLVRLCFVEEMDPKEIAKIMGISVNTVYTRKFYLLSSLRERLAS